MEQRRRHQRVPIAFPLKLRIGDIDSFTEEFCTDLSEGGIFVRMNYPPPVGTAVTLDFFLEAVGKSIHATGEVVRSVPEGKAGDGAAGMGVQFTDLGKEGKRFIELVVQKFNRQHPSQHIVLPANFLHEVDADIESTGLLPPGAPELEVRLRYGSMEGLLESQKDYLANAEIFIRADKPRPKGTAVRLTVLVEKENKMMTAKGVVVRTRTAQDTGPGPRQAGMAVHVTEAGDDLQQLMQSRAATV